MKALLVLLLSALLSFLCPPVSGQEVLTINPSASLNAVGSTGTALPSDDPFGFIRNPAQLGFTSRTNNYSYVFYPEKLISLPNSFYRYELNSYALNLGYNFNDLTGIPLSFGFGYSNIESNIIVNSLASPVENHHRENYNTYSFGLCVDYVVQLSAGFSIKDFTSILPKYEGAIIEANRIVNDFGLLLNVPVINLIDKNLALELDENNRVKPEFNFSLGYSKSNIGDSIYFFDGGRADPLPRVDRIGYGVSTGIDYSTENLSINVFYFSFTAEAEDLLVGFDNNGWKYNSTLSNLRFWKNVVQLEGNDHIVSRAGLRIDFAETISFSSGHFHSTGNSYYNKTNGFELRAKGLFKLYALWAKDPITDFLRDHIDIRYYNTNYNADSNLETKMTGLVFYVHNLNSLF